MAANPQPTINVRFAGLGGTGVIKAADVFAEVVFLRGHMVKQAEVHGMSQRGGSVQSDVRFGAAVHSPMIPDGACDFLVVLEPSQVEVVRDGLRAGGVLLTPADIAAAKLPAAKALNVALLGRLSRHFDFPEHAWRESLHAHFAEKLHVANDKAFDVGRTL
ncbi:MAG TPA: 2-oxoacid:acceptor oxidoreductase family protein [Opitutaceae bacterium]|nr:2-oxoacid:acceptor oxidoreductase family protein [Opitutaceae bacterium]HUJ41996.1 2-oxoacid:acceptor oxidoreductase family protein [Opitutaceae bacterium]